MKARKIFEQFDSTVSTKKKVGANSTTTTKNAGCTKEKDK